MKKPAIIFAVILFFLLILPLSAQYTDGWEDEFDGEEWLFMEGEGLTIVGTVNTTQQMETVTGDVIEKIIAPDIPALLEEAVGLGVTRYGPYGNNASVNIRGFDTKRVAILIDGIPVNSTSSGDFDFYSIDPLSIDRIEVIQGGSDTKYNVSGALGGVINIITVKKQNPGWSLSGSFSNTSYIPGQYNIHGGGFGKPQWQDLADTQNINLSGAYAVKIFSFHISVFGNRAGNHYLFNDHNDFTRRKEGNEILDAGTNASFIWNIGDLTKLMASGSFYYGDKNIPVAGSATNFAKQKDISSRENLMLDMPRVFHDDFSMELSLGHSWKRLVYDAGAVPSQHDEHNISLINRWSWYPGSMFTMRFGGDYRFVSIDSTNTGLHYANRGGLYVTGEFSPIKNFLLIGSVKGITDSREIVPIPKLGWAWTINDYFTIKNNYFRSFKFPDFDDLYWNEGTFTGNPNLKNEDGWGADLLIDFSFNDLLNVQSVVYGEWTDDSIHWSNISGSWRPENSGTAALAGWENKINLCIPVHFGIFGKPVLNLSWMFRLSWLLNGDLEFKDGKRIPYMPVHTVAASLELPWKTGRKNLPGSVIFSGRFESERFINTQNNSKLDPVFILNIAYNQKLNQNMGIFGKINNALNADYFSFAEYPMPGIGIILGLNLNFEGNTR